MTPELVGTAVQVLTFVAAGVWIVASIRSTTTSLRGTITSLGKSVEKLDDCVDGLRTTLSHHGERIAVLEDRSQR